jgi:hypothetical protein
MIGLLSAYLVALQALMLPLAMPPSAAFAGSLCLTASSAAPPQYPVDHDHGCPCCAGCAMQCQQPALAAGMPATVAAPQPYVVGLLAPDRFEAPRPPTHRSVQQPRAPPAA